MIGSLIDLRRLALGLSFAVACAGESSSDETAVTAADASGASDGASITDSEASADQTSGGEETGAMVCNDLDVSDAASVIKRFVAADPPDAVGGMIMGGTWERLDWVEYTGVGGQSGPATNAVEELVRFSQGTMDVAGNGWRWSYSYSTSGADLVTQQVCGEMAYPGTRFSVLDPSQLVVYGPAVGGGTFAITYLRRP